MAALQKDELLTLQKKFVLGTYAPELVLSRGAMSWVWDIDGNKYLDFGSGISVCNLGHCHPRVTEAVQRQAAKLVHVSNLYINELQPQLAAHIAENSFNGKVFFCNSGAEANEGLIKFARRWGSESGRWQVICMEDSFHGRTLATLAATGRAKYRAGFSPDTPGFVHVPFNDLAAVEAAITAETAAVLIEPVQGEGGVIPAQRGYLQKLRQLCSKHGILLLFDEVQCGLGRTGCFFAGQHYGVEPDAMSMAKALGNGYPIGAFEVQSEFADVLPPGTHATTFGGTPLACAAGIAVFETFKQENVLDNCIAMSAYISEKLTELKGKHATVQEIRGIGLMIGIQMQEPVKPIITAAQQQGLLLLSAGEDVLRMLPPLTVQREEIDLALNILDDVLSKC